MRSLKKYLITIGAGLLAVLLIIALKDIFSKTESIEIFHILCDAFFAVGVVITGIGLLVFTTNEGAFDGLTFAVGSFMNIFKRNNSKKYSSYYDYKEEHHKKKFEFGFMLICGAFFLVVSLVMYLLYR